MFTVVCYMILSCTILSIPMKQDKICINICCVYAWMVSALEVDYNKYKESKLPYVIVLTNSA